MVGRITLYFDASLVIQPRKKVVAIKRLPSSPPIDPKEKWVHFSTPIEEARKAKKNKGPSLPLDLIPSPNKKPTIEVEVEGKPSPSLTSTC